jgi:hypothetical protein
MVWIPHTGFAGFDKATDEALERLREGKEREAMQITLAAMADLPTSTPEEERAKADAIREGRAMLAQLTSSDGEHRDP